MISRRSLISNLATLVAAPAIVRASSIMPIKVASNFTCADWNMVSTLSSWVDFRGLRIIGQPDTVLTWEQLCRLPNSPPLNAAVYDISPLMGTPTLCGLFNRPSVASR